MTSNNPVDIISSLFKSEIPSSPEMIYNSSFSFPKKRRRSAHDEFRSALDAGRLTLVKMENSEPFIHWVMDGPKRVAIHCNVCKKFLGPNKGGSFFTHVKTCKTSKYPGDLPSTPMTNEQREDFTATVTEAIGKDMTFFTQFNLDSFKQCIQKALDIGYDSRQQGFGPPDASEFFCNLKADYPSHASTSTEASNIIIKASNDYDASIFHGSSSGNPSPQFFHHPLLQIFSIGEEIFIAGEFTDVSLVTLDDKELKAHRCFLSRVSPVFKSIFESKRHRQPPKIEVNFSEDITRRALLFCYGNDNYVAGFEMALLEFAKDYQIQSLTEKCLSLLESSVDVSNVCETIQVAYENGYDSLKHKCIQTIVANKEVIGKEKINSLPQAIVCDILFAQ